MTLLHNYNYSSYSSLLLKVERPTMEVSCLRRLAIEVFKTLKSLNSDFMCTYFKKASHAARRKNNLVVNRAKTTTFGEKSLRNWDLKIGILYLKTSENQLLFQNLQNSLKTWYETEYRCNICKY